jgi:hypothetical protein
MTRAAKKDSTERAPVYEVLAHDIKAMDVEAVFGLMSDDTALLATEAVGASALRATTQILAEEPVTLKGCAWRK